MEDDPRNTAVHEAGHAFVYAVLSIPFTYVTIIPDKNTNRYRGTALGSLMPIWHYCGKENISNPWLDPNDFNICFMEDLGIIAGMVAEMLYRKDEMNFTGSKSDLKQLNHNCRNKLPVSIRHKYSSFLIAYTFNLLKQKENYYLILKIAEELLEHKTLGYDQVRKIINR